MAIGIDDSLAHTGIRFSLSRFTTEEEITRTIEAIQNAVRRLRSISTAVEGDGKSAGRR